MLHGVTCSLCVVLKVQRRMDRRNVWNQPCAGREACKHEAATIIHMVDITKREIRQALSEKQFHDLVKLFPSGGVRFWGNRAGKNDFNVLHSQVDRVRAGDRVTFVAKKYIYRRGDVAYFMDNAALAEVLWGKNEGTGEVWRYMYAVHNLEDVNIPFGRSLMQVTRTEE